MGQYQTHHSTMNFVSVALVLFLQVLSSTLAIEEAPYEVINSYETYEERHYPARKWVSTTMCGHSWVIAEDFMFQKLFNYIDGGNEQEMKIDMTSPVTTLVQQGLNSDYNFTMSFLIPEVHLVDTPVPSNPDVFIEERPDLPSVFVRQFPGFAFDGDFEREAGELAADLDAAEVDYDKTTGYLVGYDAPYVIINRRNEVWFLGN